MVTGKTAADLEKYFGQFKGRIVIFGDMPPWDADSLNSTAVAIGSRSPFVMRAPPRSSHQRGKREGLTMTGGPVWRLGTWSPQVPFAFVSTKDFAAIRQAAVRGEKVTLEINLPSTTSAAPVQAYNTIADIPGTDLANEMVIIGAHIDSWDLGTGATDNGTGVVAVIEALRAIQATGLKPRRTIRVALFSGEEQGHWGSKAYVAAHQAEMANVQAVLILDLGTGKVRGWALQGREDSRALMGEAIAPLNDLGRRRTAAGAFGRLGPRLVHRRRRTGLLRGAGSARLLHDHAPQPVRHLRSRRPGPAHSGDDRDRRDRMGPGEHAGPAAARHALGAAFEQC